MYIGDHPLARRFIYGSYGYPYYGNNGFSSWGRWVLLGGIILLALLVLSTCCCHSRRRRRRGLTPLYGTGWTSARYARNNGYYGGGVAPPPPMEQQMQGGYYGDGVQRPGPVYNGQGRRGRGGFKW